MVIVHLTGYFKTDVLYQENLLCKGLAELNHDVFVLAGDLEPDFIINNKKRKISAVVEYVDDYTIIRMKPTFELKKNALTFFPGVFKKLKILKPDVVFIHDNGLYLFSAILYKLINRDVKLMWDCHSDYTNSLNSKFGKIWHRMFAIVLKIFENYFCRFYFIAPEMGKFVVNEYFLKKNIHLLRLPGTNEIDVENIEPKYLLNHNKEFIIFHSGKLPQLKKTKELYEACKKLEFQWKLVIAGAFSNDADAQKLKEELISDSRVDVLGWKSPIEIRTLMSLSDVVAQPGSLSNSFMDAACVGAPLLLASTPMANDIICEKNGYIIHGEVNINTIKSGLDFCFNNIENIKANCLKVINKFHYLTIAKQVEKDFLD